jgi:Tfp pilus assembly protein PilO
MRDERSLWLVNVLGLAACAGVALAWYFAGIQPLLRAKEARVALARTAQEQQERHSALKNSKKQHEERLAALRLQVKEATIWLEPVDHLNTRVKNLADLATAHRLRVDDIKPGAASAQSHYMGVPIRLAGQGGYQAAARFLHALRMHKQDVGITGFELKGEPEAPDKPASFTVQLLWYAAPGGEISKK